MDQRLEEAFNISLSFPFRKVKADFEHARCVKKTSIKFKKKNNFIKTHKKEEIKKQEFETAVYVLTFSFTLYTSYSISSPVC